MRNLSQVAIDKLQTRLGTEPVVIVEIQWIRGQGWLAYADRDIGTEVRGKILELSNLDDVVAITNNNDSQEIDVTFDDTSGEIKNIIDENDIHKCDVRVWQWFEGIPLDDKFLLFCGKINSPITWSEGEQTVSFSIVSQLEDKEFGFSPEEGQFPYIPVDLIGKPWPSCFGTPIDVPALAIGKAKHATTLAGLGILTGEGFYQGSGITVDDVQTARSCGMQNVQKAHVSYVMSAWINIGNNREWKKYSDQYSQLSASISQAWASRADAKAKQQAAATASIAKVIDKGLGQNPVRILGGEEFARGTITLNINGGLFTGYFGNQVGIDDNLFTITNRFHPEDDKAYRDEVAEAKEQEVAAGAPGQDFDFNSKVPCGHSGSLVDPCNYRTYGWLIFNPYPVVKADTVLPRHFWTDAGAEVTLHGYEPITYIVSIVPGTVLTVKAFKTFNGVKHLVTVPTDYYYIETKQYGDITAVQVVMHKTLSTLEEGNWSDDVYVTFRSDVGPNIVDILEYIIDMYTEFAVDSTTFDIVRSQIAAFPANFAVLDRKNVLTILQEIAYQARCSLRLINGIFYLNYLPIEPVSISSVTESDIEVNTVEVSGTETEDLVTKFIIKWRITYAKSDMNQLILRHNVKQYGVHEEEVEFYIYNQPDSVLKAATFWLIRKSNTWKQIKFKTFLNQLHVETLDCITLDFEKRYIATQPIKAIVQTAQFDSDTQTIDMSCWLPIKFGTMVPYDFAWPADVPAEWYFPTDEEVLEERSGSGWIGEDADGKLPIEDVEDPFKKDEQFISGGGGAVSRNFTTDKKIGQSKRKHDTGDKHPSDRGYSAQSIGPTTGQSGQVVSNPYHPATTTIKAPEKLPILTPMDIPLVSNGLIVDLQTTLVQDYKNDTQHVRFFGDVLHLSQDGQKLCLKKTVNIWDGENPEKEFDFKYDDERSIWGAGTAWLRD